MAKTSGGKRTIDKSTFFGILLAGSGIVVGLLLEGGRVAQILQPTAALIVFGGTIGAVMVQFPLRIIKAAGKQFVSIFVETSSSAYQRIDELIQLAHKARRDGIVSLDDELPRVTEPFLHKALMLAVDGTSSNELRKLMEFELDNQAENEDCIPRVFESAGGFAPTIGIIGAVLGLIQVMQHLENITEVGKGIAVAFVATIYGVGSANILFLPWAGKLKIRLREQQLIREMTLEGVISILEGLNPRAIESKLLSYVTERREHEGPQRVPPLEKVARR